MERGLEGAWTMLIAAKFFLKHSELICQSESPPASQRKYLESSFVHDLQWGHFLPPPPPPSPHISFLSYSSRNVPTLSPRTEMHPKPWKKKQKTVRAPKQQNSLKSGSPWCVVARGTFPCPTKPTVTQCPESRPPAAAHRNSCPAEQPKQNLAGQREKEHDQKAELGNLGPFRSGWSSLKKRNTNLGEKIVFPLVETSGQDELLLNEPTDQPFYFLCHFSYCAIDFVWALQIFLYTGFLRLFFSPFLINDVTWSWTVAPVALKFPSNKWWSGWPSFDTETNIHFPYNLL